MNNGLDTHGDHEPFIGQDNRPQITDEERKMMLEHVQNNAVLANMTISQKAHLIRNDAFIMMREDYDKLRAENEQLKATLTGIQSLVNGMVSKAGLS